MKKSSILPKLYITTGIVMFIFCSGCFCFIPLSSADSSIENTTAISENSTKTDSDSQDTISTQEIKINENIFAGEKADDNATDKTTGEDKLDSFYDQTTVLFRGAVYKTDMFLSASNEDDIYPLNSSRFNVTTGLKIEDNNGTPLKLDFNISADINLPKTEDRLGIFLETTAPEALPGRNPDEVDDALYVGLRSTLGPRKIPFGSVRVGVKARIPPVLYTELLFRKKVSRGRLHIVPQIKGFWLSDDGFGQITSVVFEWWPDDAFVTSSLTAAKWGDVTTGVEWEQSFRIGYKIGKEFKQHPQSVWGKCSVFGYKTGTGIIDKYRLSLEHRRLIYRQWLFFYLGPELEYRNESDWEPIPALRFGFDMLFWEL
ncbi:MAG: hypothetical protein HF978_05610 [Desulfobacteraceae bacterium]|nr:hypothetical protein [Desulfobacteraceae bacterium]MBC2755009.1 hypothetical protein [Desulfobacteraceae bacterium]